MCIKCFIYWLGRALPFRFSVILVWMCTIFMLYQFILNYYENNFIDYQTLSYKL